MRTLFEIIESAKVGEPTTHDECLYAVLAYSALHYFTASSMRRLKEHPNSKVFTLDGEIEEEFRRYKAALNKSPKDFVGWNNDPANPECVKRITMFRKLGDKLLAAQSNQDDAEAAK